MARALEGIRIVDFSHVVAGPLATHFLALNGADVVKIEPPAGDPLRRYTAKREQRGMAPAFAAINAGKESVVVDLKTDAGLATAMRLARGADVVVESFRPGVMKRLGLDYEAVRPANPGVIYCSISGFGQSNALSGLAAIDQVIQSLCGLMLLSGSEGEPPMRIGFPVVDTFTGLLAAFAIQTALVQRERGLASGQHIDVAMLDAALVMLCSVVNPLLMQGEMPARTGNRGFSRAPTADTFDCAEGMLTVGAVDSAQVAGLLRVLGLQHLLKQPEFADRIARIDNAESMRPLLEQAFARETAATWEEALQAAGVPAARVLTVAEAVALPHLAERDLFIEAGGATMLNAGFRFATGGPGTDRPAPELGEHSDLHAERPVDGRRAFS